VIPAASGAKQGFMHPDEIARLWICLLNNTGRQTDDERY
jgi:hypothetical protein